MTKKSDPPDALDEPEIPPTVGKHEHDPHDHPPHDHKHEHPEHSKALEDLRAHKHDAPVKPPDPAPAVIGKPPPELKEKKERVGRGLLW
jgi:hypothetical protein